MKIIKKIVAGIPDIVLLILTALVCIVVLLGYFYLLDSASLSKAWINFFSGCLVYTLTLNYSIFQFSKSRKKRNRISAILLVLFNVIPIIVIASVLYMKWFKMTDKFIIYAAGGIGLAIVASKLYEFVLKKLESMLNSKKHKDDN